MGRVLSYFGHFDIRLWNILFQGKQDKIYVNHNFSVRHILKGIKHRDKARNLSQDFLHCIEKLVHTPCYNRILIQEGSKQRLGLYIGA